MKILFVLLIAFQPPIKYTWAGKEVSYKQFQDSSKAFYFRYLDSFNHIDQKKWLDSCVFNKPKPKN